MNAFTNLSLKYIREKKDAAAVALAGVILSAALFTRTAGLAGTGMRFLSDIRAEKGGNYHLSVSLDSRDAEVAKNISGISKTYTRQSLGEYPFDGKKPPLPREGKAHSRIFLVGVGKNYYDNSPVKRVEGKYPETRGQVMLPLEIRREEGWKDISVGDKVSLPVNSLPPAEEDTRGEKPGTEKNSPENPEVAPVYTVSGFYRQTASERNLGDSYRFYTREKAGFTGPVTLYARLSDPSSRSRRGEVENMLGNFGEVCENRYLLRYCGIGGSDYTVVLVLLSGVIAAISALVSGAFICGAFSLYAGEMKRDFAVLASLGARRKDIRRVVNTLAFTLLTIGFPIGAACGLGGLWAILGFVNRQYIPGFLSLLGVSGVRLKLSITLPAILSAAALCGATVFASAGLPAYRASKISPLEAVRPSGGKEGKVSPIKVPLGGRIFGFSGWIASKNLKRNSSGYRWTVAGLSVGVFLLITLHTLCRVLGEMADTAATDPGYDFRVEVKGGRGSWGDMYRELGNMEGIKDRTAYTVYYADARVNPKDLTGRANSLNESRDHYTVTILLVEDGDFRNWLSDNGIEYRGIDSGGYLPVYRPSATLIPVEGGYREIRTFRDSGAVFTLNLPEGSFPAKVMGETEGLPFGTGKYMEGLMPIVLPMSAGEELGIMPEFGFCTFAFSRYNPQRAAQMAENVTGEYYCYTYTENIRELQRLYSRLAEAANILCRGFVAIIFLVCAVNTANWVMGGISLRRGEYAVMQTAGMTGGQAGKTVALECLFCCGRGLLFGVPGGVLASLALRFLQSVAFESHEGFRLPVAAIALSVLACALTVAVRGFAGVKRVSKDTVPEALRSEGL